MHRCTEAACDATLQHVGGTVVQHNDKPIARAQRAQRKMASELPAHARLAACSCTCRHDLTADTHLALLAAPVESDSACHTIHRRSLKSGLYLQYVCYPILGYNAFEHVKEQLPGQANSHRLPKTAVDAVFLLSPANRTVSCTQKKVELCRRVVLVYQ